MPSTRENEAAIRELQDLRAWIADHAGESISRVTLKNQIDQRVAALQEETAR